MSAQALRRRTGCSDGLKIDTVVIRGVNDDELVELVEFGRTVNAEVRFIEYMDVGGATHWAPDAVVSKREMLDRFAANMARVEPIVEDSSAPADRYRLPDGTTFGIIASTTEPFCKQLRPQPADRRRHVVPVLVRVTRYRSAVGDPRRAPARSSWRRPSRDAWQGETIEAQKSGWRWAIAAPSFRSARLKKDPHLEMHTRGG